MSILEDSRVLQRVLLLSEWSLGLLGSSWSHDGLNLGRVDQAGDVSVRKLGAR